MPAAYIEIWSPIPSEKIFKAVNKVTSPIRNSRILYHTRHTVSRFVTFKGADEQKRKGRRQQRKTDKKDIATNIFFCFYKVPYASILLPKNNEIINTKTQFVIYHKYF